MTEATPLEVTPVVAVEEPAVIETPKLGWKSELPEPIRDHEAFKSYETKKDLWNGHIGLVEKVKDLEGKVASAIVKPGDKATDEERAAYRLAMDIPEKAEDYEIDLPEGADQSLSTWFRQIALDAGISKDAAKNLSTSWNAFMGGIQKANDERMQKAHDEALETLTKEWGPDATTNAEAVKKGYQVLQTPALDDLLRAEITIGDKKVQLGNHPAIVSLILAIGKKVSPDTGMYGGPNAGSGGSIDQQARAFYEKPTEKSGG